MAQPQIESQLSSFQDISTSRDLHEFEEYMDHPNPDRRDYEYIINNS